jgi:hypothetical protein
MTLKVKGLETATSFPCAFCSGQLHPSAPDAPQAFLLHSVPPCQKFVEMDPLDFLVACRKVQGMTASWDVEDKPQ